LATTSSIVTNWGYLIDWLYIRSNLFLVFEKETTVKISANILRIVDFPELGAPQSQIAPLFASVLIIPYLAKDIRNG